MSQLETSPTVAQLLKAERSLEMNQDNDLEGTEEEAFCEQRRVRLIQKHNTQDIQELQISIQASSQISQIRVVSQRNGDQTVSSSFPVTEVRFRSRHPFSRSRTRKRKLKSLFGRRLGYSSDYWVRNLRIEAWDFHCGGRLR